MIKRSPQSEGGFVSIEFVLGTAFLLLPVTLLILILPTWSERQSVARVAAREAARTYVVSSDLNRSREAAFQVSDNGGIKRDAVTVDLTGDPTLRGSSVRAAVRIQVPATFIPILGANTNAFEITSTHAEVVDLYRSL